MAHKFEELEAAVEEALRRQEVLKACVQVMATKAGMDWDAVVAKARKRIEAAERVEAEMEAEREAKEAAGKGASDA